MLSRSYYTASFCEFMSADPDAVLGQLVASHGYTVEDLQRNAWVDQISILRTQIAGDLNISGRVLFEFAIPRMGRRVDIVILYRGLIFVVEFKVGESSYPLYALDQAYDYALDLKNFHSGSHHKKVVPILVATEAKEVERIPEWSTDGVCAPLRANKQNILSTVQHVAQRCCEPELDDEEWEKSVYRPTPTIIEAAQALYRKHRVTDIARHDAQAINLDKTAAAIGRVIERAKEGNGKAICFITGVPGSGKTLAGLNIATERQNIDKQEHAVFLSGNGPLVAVLREALARDLVLQKKQRGESIRKTEARRQTEAFIQNIHHFRDDNLRDSGAPTEKVVVFDEAQRAWNQAKAAKFMAKNKGIRNFDQSEPSFLIGVMDRHDGYAVIVCLVGGGQEINDGEAGLPEWFKSIQSGYPDWSVHVSDRLTDTEYTRGGELIELISPDKLHIDENLHLSVPMRSFRSERVSDFIKSLLDERVPTATSHAKELLEQFPIVLTRDIDVARRWLRSKGRGTERFGIVASSGALRLKPEGINVKAKITPEYWFLNDKKDVRSCYYLEDAATEFDIQGLELDWTCVAWDADFRMGLKGWEYRKFRGASWIQVRDDMVKLYIKNSYRVLLTRARQGMVIFLPLGDPQDVTRKPEFYDLTYTYLRSLGLPEIAD